MTRRWLNGIAWVLALCPNQIGRPLPWNVTHLWLLQTHVYKIFTFYFLIDERCNNDDENKLKPIKVDDMKREKKFQFKTENNNEF